MNLAGQDMRCSSSRAARTSSPRPPRNYPPAAYPSAPFPPISSTTEGRAALIAQIQRLGDPVDILVNNAGIGLSGPFADQAPDDIGRLLQLNVAAVTHLTRAFLPDMLARRWGGILNVASLAGLVPGPHQAAYYASKAYILSLTEALAEENRGLGVRIAVLAPGPVATKFHHRMGAERSYYLPVAGVMSAEQVARSGYRGFMRGRTLIVPGILNPLAVPAFRLLPHTLALPVVSWMLRRR